MSETNFVRLSKTLTLGAMAGVGVELTGADVEALVRTITGMGEEIRTLNARIAELEAENAALKAEPKPLAYWSDEKKQTYADNEGRSAKGARNE